MSGSFSGVLTHLLAAAASDDIWLYVVTQTNSETMANRQIELITKRFYLLASHPPIGRARDEDLGHGRRSFRVDGYVIVYRILRADVEILRVAHGRRNLEALFEMR